MIDIGTITEEELHGLDDRIIDKIYSRVIDPRDVSLRKYCPHRPWPKQRLFLDLECREAFFGGAAGPGKSDALLMCALQYVHVPNYSALILRRDYARLSLPGSIMDRARSWLYSTDATWNGEAKAFRFPSGATIQFGYIDQKEDRFRYASSEFQLLLYDELTEFSLDDTEDNPYLFLFSRLRKTDDMPVPLRVRSASNPGNVGHAWVKKRFITDEATSHMMSCEDRTPRVFWNGDRGFIPGLLADNPAINPDDYLPSLAHLPPITRARLLKGDWSVREDGLIQSDWPLRYRVGDDGLITVYDSTGREVTRWHESESYRFSTCDPAGTAQDKARSSRGHDHSWSVIQTWDKAPASSGPIIALRNNWRQRVPFTGLLDGLRQVHAEWSPSRMRIENEKLGCAAQELLRDELPIDTVPTGGKDKVSRASVLLQKLERGEVALPYAATWLEALEAEWYAWTGHPDETSDQIDAAAYAAMESQGRGYGMWGAELFGPEIWVEQFPVPTCVVACVLPVDHEKLGEGLSSAVVAVQVSGDGRFCADCFVGDVPPSQLLEQVRPLEQSTRGQIPLAIATTESMTTAVLEWVVGAYSSATFVPQVFELDPKLCANGTPEALTPFWLERLVRFRSGSAHARALINRAKAYPHTEDVAPLMALGLAIETLSTIKGSA